MQIKFRPDASADSEVSNTRMLLDTQLVIEDSYVNPADATQNTNVSNAGGDDTGDGEGDGDDSEGGQTAPERPWCLRTTDCSQICSRNQGKKGQELK